MATIQFEGKEHRVQNDISIESAMESLGMLPNTMIYLMSGIPMCSDAILNEGMVIKAIRVASGG